jgi:hypothetical protein
VSNFLGRKEEFKTKFIREYNHGRAKLEGPKLIYEWLTSVKRTIGEEKIMEDDIYNFDESGFLSWTYCYCKSSGYVRHYGKPVRLWLGNREWVTVVEAIDAIGFAFLLIYLLKGEASKQILIVCTRIFEGDSLYTRKPERR